MAVLTIEIYSDNVCPWCYIGKRRLERAMALHKKTYPGGSRDTFKLVWLPYYLDPDAPRKGQPLEEVLAARYTAERHTAVKEKVKKWGLEEGIVFSYGGKTGSTRDSHRLIALAGTKGAEVQDRVVQRLFEEYFERDADITDAAMLIRAGTEAGMMGEAEVTDWIVSGKGGEQVDAAVERGLRDGAGRGVPRYVIQGEHRVDGAQDPAAFLDVFARVRQAEAQDVSGPAADSEAQAAVEKLNAHRERIDRFVK